MKKRKSRECLRRSRAISCMRNLLFGPVWGVGLIYQGDLMVTTFRQPAKPPMRALYMLTGGLWDRSCDVPATVVEKR